MITLLLTIIFLPVIIVFGIVGAILELLFCPFVIFGHHHHYGLFGHCHHHGLFGHHHCWGHHHWWQKKGVDNMLTFICMIAMLIGLVEITWLAFKATWGITKFLLSIVIFPIIFGGMILVGLFYLALPLLIIFAIFGAFRCIVVQTPLFQKTPAGKTAGVNSFNPVHLEITCHLLLFFESKVSQNLQPLICYQAVFGFV